MSGRMVAQGRTSLNALGPTRLEAPHENDESWTHAISLIHWTTMSGWWRFIFT